MQTNDENENQEQINSEQNNEQTENKQQNTQNSQQTKTSTGLDDNIAGLLCYVAGLITGIVFLIIEKENKFVRFHALQSIFISVVLIIASTILSFIPLLNILAFFLLPLITLFLWLFLMYKAYNKELYKLPVIGDMVEKQL